MKFFRLLLLLIVSSTPTWADELFCIHPAGINKTLSQCATTGPCAGPQDACDLNTANTQLSAGQTALLMAGSYNSKIKPVNNGLDNSNRITYRAMGNGDVVLENCTGSGGVLGAAGAINLDDKDFVEIDGKDKIKVLPTQGCAIGVSLCGSLGGIIDGITIHSCPQEPGPVTPDGVCINHIGRLVSFCNEAFQIKSSRATENNVFSNNTLIANLDNSKNCATCTEDALVIEFPQKHNVIRGNKIFNATHVALKLTMAEGYGVVVYGNTIKNIAHTPVSIYRSGGLRPEPDTYESGILFSRNQVTGSYDGPGYAFSAPGNGLQGGSAGGLYRYNTFANSGTHLDVGDATNMVSFSWGNGGPTKRIACARNYFLNNTFARGSGNMYACKSNFTPDDTRMTGGNNLWNNIFYHILPTKGSSGQGRQIFYSSIAKLSNGYINEDRWVSNYFGDPNVPEPNSIVWVSPGPEQTFSQAFNNTQWANDPDYPNFTPWHGFENNYKQDINTYFMAYPPNGLDLRLKDTAPIIDQGAPVTRVAQTDKNSSNTLHVENARWFYQECANFPAWTGVQCEQICVGKDPKNITTAQCGVQIKSVDWANNTLVLTKSISRSPGEFLWIYADSHGRKTIHGSAPDIGADEVQGSTAPISRPINFRFQ